jgi:cell division septation protein DedD
LVDKSHQDIAGREAYLVYSIVCPKSNIIGGSIKDGLQNLKKLYKTRNADYTIRTNMFTNDQVRSAITNLTFSSGSTRSIGNNTVCYFQNESELNLNDYSGNEVYFMQTGSNPELPSHLNLSTQQLSLGQINQENQNKLQSVGEFRNLLSSKNNLARATGLYNEVVNHLSQNEKTAFENWSSQEKIQNAAIQLKQLIAQFTKNKATDITPCEAILSQYPGATTHLNIEENKALVEWQNQADSQKIAKENKTINDLTLEIENAATKNYEPQIESFENKLKSLGLEWRLSADAKPKLIKWREHHQGNTIILDVTALYSEIKRLDENNDRRAILSRQKEWNNKIDGFAKRFEGKNLLQGSDLEHYKYLYNGKWQRKERPIAKIAMLSLIAISLGGGLLAFNQWDTWFPKKDIPEADNKIQKGPVANKDTTESNEDKNKIATSVKHTFKGKEYTVEKDFLTQKGCYYGKRYYRYFDNGYKYQEEKGNTTWKKASDSDLIIVLKSWDAKFKAQELKETTPPPSPPSETTPESSTPALTTPKTTTPKTTTPTEFPKVTTPKVTTTPNKTLNAEEKAAKFEEIKALVRAGKCNAGCIIQKVEEFQLSPNQSQKLNSNLP